MCDCSVHWDGKEYPSVENAYQAAKCYNYKDRDRIASMSAPDSKRFVKTCCRAKDFKSVPTMLTLLEEKFSVGVPFSKVPNKKAILQVKLLGTERQIIVEGNLWHDNFWGNCTCGRCLHTPGANVLGSLLMCVRDKIS